MLTPLPTFEMLTTINGVMKRNVIEYLMKILTKRTCFRGIRTHAVAASLKLLMHFPFNCSYLNSHMNNNSLSGQIPPQLSRLPKLVHLLLDNNNLSGYLPPELSEMPSLQILQLDNNNFAGSEIPSSYSAMSLLLKMSLANNSLSGSDPSSIWQNRTLNESERLSLDFQNNMFSNISGSPALPLNVTVRLHGNPICLRSNLVQFCGSQDEGVSNILNKTDARVCISSCPPPYELAPPSPDSPCFCAAPLLLEIDSAEWQEGPRLRMYLKIYPVYVNNTTFKFNESEVTRIRSLFSGWNIPDSEMLIYEFMSNGTLRDHLSGKSKLPLSFAMRVADFGLSRLAPVPELEGGMPSYVSTVVKGTPGYLDPEYFLTHKLTDKSDVYSLGVVFLELLTGMHPISHGKNIVREVNIAYRSSVIFSVIDEEMGSYPSECVEKFIDLALKCCQDETDSRPSMAEVVRELENIWLMTPESDTKISESKVTDPGKDITPPSSSTSLKHPYVSQDISSSDLVSGVIPTVTPR
ncbi:unnamed protein product [Fraxinus pennsylvanica]|uniref:Protein kinase domain-containing protein n=1 Tax=Fraxinus pennsylvanica TaxID=56036 RepID=A0AAD1ZVT8_9LAMI|nr:unnamed protein product [Fraxinus pennsylvanica]